MKNLELNQMLMLEAGKSNRRCMIYGGLTFATAIMGPFTGGAGFIGALALAGMAVNEGCFDD